MSIIFNILILWLTIDSVGLSGDFLLIKLIYLIFDLLNFILQVLLASYQVVYLLASNLFMALHGIVMACLNDELLLVFVCSVELSYFVQFALTFQ